jgi:hypothetical protein
MNEKSIFNLMLTVAVVTLVAIFVGFVLVVLP